VPPRLLTQRRRLIRPLVQDALIDSGLFVQHVGQANSGTATSLNVGISSAPTTGHHLIIGVRGGGGSVVSSVSDTQGNTYQVDVAPASSGATASIVSCHITNPLTTADTITITMSGSSNIWATVNEYQGLASSGWFDIGAASNGNSSASALVSPFILLTGGPELLVGVGSAGSNVAFADPNGSGYMILRDRQNNANGAVMMADHLAPAIDNLNATATFVSSATWGMAIAAYVLAGAGTTYTPTITDAIGTTDGLLRELDRPVGPDSEGLTDSLLRSLGRPITDAEGLTDTMLRSLGRPITDSEGLTDSLLRSLGRPITDAEGLTDTMLRSLGRTLTDPEGLTDGLARSRTRSLADAEGLTDSLLRSLSRSLTDPQGLTDAVLRQITRPITDPEGLTDAVLRSLTRPIGPDAEGLTDAVAYVKGKTVTLADAQGLTDALVRSLGRVITDLEGVADTASRTLSALRTITDPQALSDAEIKALSHSLTLPAEAMGLTDAQILGGSFVRLIGDMTDAVRTLDLLEAGGAIDTAQGGLTIEDDDESPAPASYPWGSPPWGSAAWGESPGNVDTGGESSTTIELGP